MSGSKRMQMDRTDWRKWGIGVLIATLGAVGTYFSDQIPGLEEAGREELAGMFVIFCTVISFVRKLVLNNQTPEPEPETRQQPTPKPAPVDLIDFEADTDAWDR